MKKLLILFIPFLLWAGNYPLQIIAPRDYGADSLLSHYYKTYPGIAYEVPVRALGGDYPFTYTLLENPSGMTIDDTLGIITWSNPLTAGSPHAVSVEVADSGLTEKDTISWTITVTTSDFYFVDDDAGAGGDGSIGSPFDALSDIYSASYSGDFIIFRAGTYDLSGLSVDNSGAQQERVDWDNADAPVKWIGYPGEAVIIDHDATTNGAYFLMSDEACNYAWFQNITFRDMLNHTMRIQGDNMVWYDCELKNGGPGNDGDNSSFIMTVDGTGYHQYCIVSNCDFDSATTDFAYTKLYQTQYWVIEQNKLDHQIGGGEGHALKYNNDNCVIQGDTLDNITDHAINGNWNASANNEIRFNKIINSNPSGGYGALTVNYHGTAGTHYIYRNTFEGTVVVRFAQTGDGPFNFRDNVIVNESAGATGFPHIDITYDDDTSVINLDGNITGYAADNIIDADGDLQGSYYDNYFTTKGYQIGLTGSGGDGGSSEASQKKTDVVNVEEN